MKLLDIAIDKLKPDPDQPRKTFKAALINELALDLRNRGQIVPVIVFQVEDWFQVADGHQRLMAAVRAELKFLKALVLDERPSEFDLTAMRVQVNCMRADLNPVERFDTHRKLMELKKINLTELSKVLNISKTTATRIDSLGKLPPQVLDLMRQGIIGLKEGYSLSQLTADELEDAMRKYFNGEADEPAQDGPVATAKKRQSRVQCQLDEGSVLIRGNDTLTLEGMQAILEKLVRLIRKARKEGLDVTALSHALRCKASKAEPKPC